MRGLLAEILPLLALAHDDITRPYLGKLAGMLSAVKRDTLLRLRQALPYAGCMTMANIYDLAEDDLHWQHGMALNFHRPVAAEWVDASFRIVRVPGMPVFTVRWVYLGLTRAVSEATFSRLWDEMKASRGR